MKLANIITLSRLLLTIVGFVLLACHSGDRASGAIDWVVFALFTFAALTDYVDGWVARRYGQVSLFGRIFDPLGDKVLVVGALMFYAVLDSTAALAPAWVVVVFLTREFLVQSLRGAAEGQGVEFGADKFGKWKMFAQCVYVLGISLWQCGVDWPYHIVIASMWISLAMTVASGANYVRKAWGLLDV